MLSEKITFPTQLRILPTAFNMRLGIIVVHNDPTPEMELWRQVIAPASIHTVRFKLPRNVGEVFIGSDIESLLEYYDLEKALLTLRDIGVDAICLCFTSASIFSGPSFDKDFIEHARRLTGCAHITTSVKALVSELINQQHHTIAMIIPPWYSPETVEAFRNYFQHHGIVIPYSVPYELTGKWEFIPRQDRFDVGAVWHISPESIADCAFKQLKNERANFSAVIVPGSGFPSLEAGKIIRQRLEKPYYSVNSASWSWFMSVCQQRKGV